MNEVAFPAELLGTDTLLAARSLIGARLVRGSGPNSRIGRIVEVEAYIGREDLASHARTGPTRRNATMFGPPGRAYVYLVYGMYHCLNIVTQTKGNPAAVLIRAVEPLAGMDFMRAARMERLARRSPAPVRAADSEEPRVLPSSRLPDARLASGPGLVCVAFSIDRGDDGVDLCDPTSDLRLEVAPKGEAWPVETGPRVGIDYAPEPWLSRPWRLYVPGSPAVSVAATRRPRAEAAR
jgi:DNA-3-methyladenine glycosylase